MIEARPSIATIAQALKAAVPTLDPAEQRLALQLYRMLLAGRPVGPADLATAVGVDVGFVEGALGGSPGVFRDRKGRVAEHPGTFTLTVDKPFEIATRSRPDLFSSARVDSPAAVAEGRDR